MRGYSTWSFKSGDANGVHMGKFLKMPVSATNTHADVDSLLTLSVWCNNGGAAKRFESPEPNIPYLFVVFCSKAKIGLSDRM